MLVRQKHWLHNQIRNCKQSPKDCQHIESGQKHLQLFQNLLVTLVLFLIHDKLFSQYYRTHCNHMIIRKPTESL